MILHEIPSAVTTIHIYYFDYQGQSPQRVPYIILNYIVDIHVCTDKPSFVHIFHIFRKI